VISAAGYRSIRNVIVDRCGRGPAVGLARRLSGACAADVPRRSCLIVTATSPPGSLVTVHAASETLAPRLGGPAGSSAGTARARQAATAAAASALTTNVHRFDHAALGLGRPQR
jgi:hypothetical protein